MFSLITLGISSASPTTNRYPSAHILKICGRLFLIDCGEGTQLLMKRYRLSMNKVQGIFISHLHADHILGIPGFLSSASLAGRTEPLDIYAVPPMEKMLEFFTDFFEENLPFELRFHPIEAPGILVSDPTFEVVAFPLDHRVETYGFVFYEKKRRAVARKMVYCSDTAPLSCFPQEAMKADILLHEATFASEKADLARTYFHSTAADAARAARLLDAKRLVLTHFSSRYNDLRPLLDEARVIFPETYLASEGAEFSVPLVRLD